MTIWEFRIPSKGDINTRIEAETEEQAREILKTDDWDFLDEYCFDPEIDKAILTRQRNATLKARKEA